MDKSTVAAADPTAAGQTKQPNAGSPDSTSPASTFFERLLGFFGLRSSSNTAPPEPAADPGMLYEREFATEHEAVAFSRSINSVEYRTQVQQNVYDYSWSVEVYPAARHAGTASNDEQLAAANAVR